MLLKERGKEIGRRFHCSKICFQYLIPFCLFHFLFLSMVLQFNFCLLFPSLISHLVCLILRLSDRQFCGCVSPLIMCLLLIPIRSSSSRSTAYKHIEGERLTLNHVQRTDMGGYLCIASNGVPPSVSKRYEVQVNCKFSISYPCLTQTEVKYNNIYVQSANKIYV